ncbi:unnamed protein product [Lampetra planeri]
MLAKRLMFIGRAPRAGVRIPVVLISAVTPGVPPRGRVGSLDSSVSVRRLDSQTENGNGHFTPHGHGPGLGLPRAETAALKARGDIDAADKGSLGGGTGCVGRRSCGDGVTPAFTARSAASSDAATQLGLLRSSQPRPRGHRVRRTTPCASYHTVRVVPHHGFYGSCQQRAGGAAMRPSKRELPALHGITRTLSPPPASPVGGAPPPATPAAAGGGAGGRGPSSPCRRGASGPRGGPAPGPVAAGDAGAGGQGHGGHPPGPRPRLPRDPVRAALEAELSFYGLSLSDLSPAQVATLVAVVTDGQGGRPGPPVAVVETGGGRQGPPAGPGRWGGWSAGERGGGSGSSRDSSGGGRMATRRRRSWRRRAPRGGRPHSAAPSRHVTPPEHQRWPSCRPPPASRGGGVPGGGGPTEGGGATSLEYGYVVADHDPLSVRDGLLLMEALSHNLGISLTSFTDVNVIGPALAFQIGQNEQNLSVSSIAEAAVRKKAQLEKDSGVRIIQMGVGEELCRQRMAARCAERGEGVPPAPAHGSRVSSVSSQQSDAAQRSPSSRSSSSSWCEEPVASTMDISTGHMVLAYMEDHLSNKERLSREWESLCSEQADPAVCTVALAPQHAHKNRTAHSTPYDHARIVLKADVNPSHSDYINASPIMDHDPRSPSYIATQGPLPHTVADFWQMVWEQGCVVLVMLTPLSENGVRQCQRYWPDEGSNLYHIYEVNLVSEHIWCEDFLVRSFYLKNIRSGETRTLTQFHFLSWPDHAVPASTRSLLDFRRKVNKCYRGRSCPIIIHCSDGAGRTGTYLLIDMVLNRMAKGTKEIDIAATLEHIRDQRAGMVRTKEQFEFALTALAEEVNAILKSLPK